MKRYQWLSLILVAIVTAIIAGCFPAAMDPSGKFAYVMDNNKNLLVYAIDPNTGTPSVKWEYNAGTTVQPVIADQVNDFLAAVDPSGRFLYVELRLQNNSTSKTITGAEIQEYQIDPDTHALSGPTTVATWTGSTYSGFNGLVAEPLGRYLYMTDSGSGNGTDGGVYTFSINPQTGALTQIGASKTLTSGMTEVPVADPKGQYLFLLNSSMAGGSKGVMTYAIQANGTLKQVAGPFMPAGITGPESMAIDQTGSYIVLTDDDSTATTANMYVAQLDRSTGAFNSLGAPVPAGKTPGLVMFDLSNKYVYAKSGNHTVLTFSFNPATGALTPGTPSAVLGGGLTQLLTNGVMK